MIDYLKNESIVIDELKSNYKLKIEEACFSTDWIPKHILLDRTRNIHSYFIFATFYKNIYKGRYFNNDNNFENDIIELIKTQYSKLDRPLFLIIQDENYHLLGIEASTIREFILENKQIQTIKNFISNNAIGLLEIISQIKLEL